MNERPHEDFIVRASFKDCPVLDRKKFAISNCIMPISVGQKLHEGKKFEATVNLINRSFKECTILIDDTIQRYTLAIGTEFCPNDLYEYSLGEGESWLKRNEEKINNFSIPVKILRWDFWVKNENYIKKFNMVSEAFESDESYKKGIVETIEEFLNRFEKNKNPLTKEEYEKAYVNCLNYLKEECACMCLWAEEGYDYEVYPTGRNKAMSETHSKFIIPFFAEKLKSVSLRFKKHYKNKEKNKLVFSDSVV